MSYYHQRRTLLEKIPLASSTTGILGLTSTAINAEKTITNAIYPEIDPKKLNIGIFIYPHMTMLDAYAPLQALAISKQFNVFTFAKTQQLLPSDANVNLVPNYSFSNCPNIDVLIVPGSANPLEQLNDIEVINYIKEVGNQAKYITSVCTGALILAEAGLLDNFSTTIHWAYSDILKYYPNVTYINQRVVKDRNRISGGGITAGLDFALALIAEISNASTAQALELLLEYDPQPPFNTGNHNTAPPKLKNHIQQKVHHIAKDLFERNRISLKI
ncbi:thiamine biosynthesis protein ThiJ [Photobacterium kishitanii]|uniref:DJ-1/PfpI family protein n=1 Tax=Photobacterium kishitanii TaxID=318456 RepID=UPI000D1679D9|nr:DJ-1/PfpI family protein [Photobacterium kishitanii]PSV16920.1 thiamine biosynthesis protein ThiJ [Photobacterium kishitanii]